MNVEHMFNNVWETPWKRAMTVKSLKLKAILLAAGRRRRLGKTNPHVPKILLHLRDNQTILEYTLRSMNETKLFEKVIIVTGYMHSKVRSVIEELSPKNSFEINCIFNPKYDSKSVLYSVEAGLSAAGDGDILLMNGDTFYSTVIFGKIQQILAIRGVRVGSIIGSFKSARTYGSDEVLVRSNNSNRIVRVGKNLEHANAVSAGVILIFGSIRDQYINTLRKLKPLNNAIHHNIIDALCQDGVPITFVPVSPHDWAEIDTAKDYERVLKKFRK